MNKLYINSATSMTMGDFFYRCGFQYLLQEPPAAYSVKKKNIYIKAYDTEKKEIIKAKVLTLFYKPPAPYYFIITERSGRSFKASPDHKLYVHGEYIAVKDLPETFEVLLDTGFFETCIKKQVDASLPILDIEVENAHNYFANGILSKNSTPGGRAVKFYASWRGRVSKVEDILDKKEVIGNVIKIKNTKSKIGFPKRTAQLDLYYSSGFNPAAEYLDFIISLGLVRVGGAGWFSQEEWGLKVQGRNNFLAWLQDHPEIFEQCKQAVNDSFKTSSFLRAEEEEKDTILEMED